MKITFYKNKYIKLFQIFLVIFFFFISFHEAQALIISVNVPEKYTEVKAGERLYFEVEIRYPENPSRKDLRLVYKVLEGEEIITESKFLKAVETQASFVDYMVIPESAGSGLHRIVVEITDYEELNQEVYASFNVVAQKDEMKIYFILIMSAIVFVGLVITLQIRRMKKIIS